MAEKTLEITAPARNTADEWNLIVRETAEKEGIELPGAAATAPAAKKEDEKQETIYQASLTIDDKEMVFQDKDPAAVLKQYTAAVEAAQLGSRPAAAAAAKIEEEPKPAFTEAELFDIGMKLQKGDVSAIETFINKSGLIDRRLEELGIRPAEVKANLEKSQSQEVHDAWKSATDQYLEKIKAGESDFPGGQQNMYIMGVLLSELKLPPTVESFDLAYAEMKKRNMVFPVEKAGTTTTTTTTATTKKAASSTAVGSHGRPGTESSTAAIDPTRKFELDLTQLTPRQYSESYNELIRAGVKPEQIVIKQ